MIAYLGMPRCASSWLYNNLKHIETGELVKEPHTLYTNPVNLDNYCNNRVLDFSTNNWSMDSNVAKAVDAYVTDYILIVRDQHSYLLVFIEVIPYLQKYEYFFNFK